jgi:hypothetical protein
LDSLIFAASAFGLDFFHLDSLILLSPFPCLKTLWIFNSLNLAHSLVLSKNCKNQMFWNSKPDSPVLPDSPNLVINIYPYLLVKLVYWKAYLDQICHEGEFHSVSSAIFVLRVIILLSVVSNSSVLANTRIEPFQVLSIKRPWQRGSLYTLNHIRIFRNYFFRLTYWALSCDNLQPITHFVELFVKHPDLPLPVKWLLVHKLTEKVLPL